MAINDQLKTFQGGGLDTDSAPELVEQNDYTFSQNIRTTGTATGEAGYLSNIESNELLTGSLPSGINFIDGGGRFEDTGQILAFRFNSAGNCQILLYSAATQSYQVIYTDVTNSGGATLLPLNPSDVVTSILVNKTYAVWWANGLEVGYTNLKTLASGGYGTVLWEDLSLLKPQCLIPPTWSFGNDAGTPANYLYSNLGQFSVQYVNADYNYSAWSTWSSRATPYQENTPTLGANVSQNNYIIVTVNIGSVRANIVNIACRFGLNIFYTIKSVYRSYILALPTITTFTITAGSGYTNGVYTGVSLTGGTGSGAIATVTVSGNVVTAVTITTPGGGYAVGDVLTGSIPGGTGWSITVTAVVTAVNVATEIYEAYNAAANTYSFAFYNNTTNVPVDTQESGLTYDYIWPANAGALINGNIIGLADWTTLYARPATPVLITAVGYNPNIAIPAGHYSNSWVKTGQFNGASGSGAGNHQRIISISFGGVPATNDEAIVATTDLRGINPNHNYNYVVPSSLSGNLAGVVAAWVPQFPNGSYVENGDGTYTITWIDSPYYELSNYAITLYYAGASVANSIPSVLDNSQGQLALSYRDYKGRFFPLCTTNQYQWKSPSYAQVGGNAIELAWTITNAAAPPGAVDYQWLCTAPPVTNIVDTLATLMVYISGWNAATNTPALALNSGNAGQTYQVTTPASPAVPASYHNLGNNDTYNVGDYIVDNSLSYDLLDKTFGNFATTGTFLAFSLQSLKIYSDSYQQEGVNTVLAYDYSPGDRCTLHYWIGAVQGVEGFTITAGSGYTAGIYYGVALTGGTGSGAIATVTVNGSGAVSAVVITTPGTGYLIGDSLTGTVTGGSGWSITVTSYTPSGINYFNNPCIDLSVLGYDAGTYILKVENSEAITYSGGHVLYNGIQIDVRNIFLRLYSPSLQNQSSQTSSQSTTVWYEIGQRFPITNGLHTVLTGSITDGGVYYKTRQFADAILPYFNTPVQVLATDLNYSDFYASAFWSAGRARTYYDELEQTTQAASIITSQNYILGSKNNGLNRLYPSTIYGEGNGQTSSAQGGIQIMWQRGNILVILQELNVFYCPVNITYTQLNEGETQESISNQLLNNGRYAAESIGIGTLKAFCTRFDRAYFVSPQYSEPFEIDVEAGIRSISGKMSKFFKAAIQLAVQLGYNIFMYYNEFYEEPTVCISSPAGIVQFPFSLAQWNPFNEYTITPSEVSSTPNGSHCTAAYNNVSGLLTLTPSTNYVGADSTSFTFNPGSGNVTVNLCLSWVSGSGTVNPFIFAAIVGAPLSTVEDSNIILVNGPNYPVAISITGSTGLGYSINGGAFTTASGLVAPGSTVQVKVTSSASNSTLTSCTLTIGGTSATFDVTTLATGAFSLYAQYGVNIVAVTNGSATGVPSAFATANLLSGNGVAAAYTTVTNGTIDITISGTPVLGPSHTQLYLEVAGVTVNTVTLVGGKTLYSLTLGTTQNSPTLIQIGVQTI